MEKEKLEQLRKKLEQIEAERFELAMKDTWFTSDFRRDDALWQEQLKIKKEIEKARFQLN